jgi:hypothetical protein
VSSIPSHGALILQRARTVKPPLSVKRRLFGHQF